MVKTARKKQKDLCHLQAFETKTVDQNGGAGRLRRMESQMIVCVISVVFVPTCTGVDSPAVRKVYV